LPAQFSPGPWDRLLLDAESLLPEIGPALVLAFTAVETRIESALRILVPKEGPAAGLWAWIEKLDYWRSPSVADQLNRILRALTGHSLLDEQKLWTGFNDLKRARNDFVHAGRASLPLERARELIDMAGEIIDWVEALLPPEERRPRYEGQGEGARVE